MQSVVEEHLSYFQFCLIRDDTAVNIVLQVSDGHKYSFFLQCYPPVESPDHRERHRFSFGRNCQFSKVALPIYLPSGSFWEFQTLTSLPIFGITHFS